MLAAAAAIRERASVKLSPTALAAYDPAWVQQHAPPDWYPRYGLCTDRTRFPKEATKRETLAQTLRSAT